MPLTSILAIILNWTLYLATNCLISSAEPGSCWCETGVGTGCQSHCSTACSEALAACMIHLILVFAVITMRSETRLGHTVSTRLPYLTTKLVAREGDDGQTLFSVFLVQCFKLHRRRVIIVSCSQRLWRTDADILACSLCWSSLIEKLH